MIILSGLKIEQEIVIREENKDEPTWYNDLMVGSACKFFDELYQIGGDFLQILQEEVDDEHLLLNIGG